MTQEWNIWFWSFSKAIDSMKKVFSILKYIRKSRIFMLTSRKKSFHRKHTIKNYVLNELKRYIKYNSEKLGFLKLRNKFFDRLRNRGFRKYSLAKMFSTVSYMSRDKYLSSNDKIYSAFVQETQVEMVLDEAAEDNFQEHLKPDQNERETGTSIRERIISPTDKVVSFQTTLDQTTKLKKDYFLGFVFPGNCVEIHKAIKKIFDEELEKNCKASPTFKACFENCAIGPLFRNEKKIGAIISKTKI